jgi:hypothetical protein
MVECGYMDMDTAALHSNKTPMKVPLASLRELAWVAYARSLGDLHVYLAATAGFGFAESESPVAVGTTQPQLMKKS